MIAKVKATGEIVDVHNSPFYPDIWYGAGLPYGTSELEFISTSKNKCHRLDFLTHFTDQELKDELKRRDKERQSQYPSNLHCRDCKYCREGRTFKLHLWTTTVCFAKPKPKMGSERYYATSLSCKICEKFEPK